MRVNPDILDRFFRKFEECETFSNATVDTFIYILHHVDETGCAIMSYQVVCQKLRYSQNAFYKSINALENAKLIKTYKSGYLMNVSVLAWTFNRGKINNYVDLNTAFFTNLMYLDLSKSAKMIYMKLLWRQAYVDYHHSRYIINEPELRMGMSISEKRKGINELKKKELISVHNMTGKNLTKAKEFKLLSRGTRKIEYINGDPEKLINWKSKNSGAFRDFYINMVESYFIQLHMEYTIADLTDAANVCNLYFSAAKNKEIDINLVTESVLTKMAEKSQKFSPALFNKMVEEYINSSSIIVRMNAKK